MFIVVLIYSIWEINVFYILKTYDSLMHINQKSEVDVVFISVGFDNFPQYLNMYVELRVILIMAFDYWIFKRIQGFNNCGIMLKSNTEYWNLINYILLKTKVLINLNNKRLHLKSQ